MHPTWQFRSEGQQLTAFCRADGTRLSLGPTPQRLRAPELLDVKLTDVCSVGCAFCYQDSRPDRQHARLEDVAFIAAEAGKAGVFEVALGGGEVSEYPDFVEALRLFRAAGVVPNFTTRRIRWLAREWATLRELVGGVAVSVGSAAEIRLLGSLIPVSQRRAGQLVAQVVMGTVERAELLTLMRAAGEAQIRVTLLGFKDVGRGQSYRPLDYGWWLDDLPQYVALTPVSIDTALAAECPETLERLLVRGSYHTEEGRFSAYIDAVNMTLAPSSCHAGPHAPFDAHWLEAFAAPDFVQGPATPPTMGRVRLGFATNSSSSHSLVLFRDESSINLLSDYERQTLVFTDEQKRLYIAQYAMSFFREDNNPEAIEQAKKLFDWLGLSDLKPGIDAMQHHYFTAHAFEELGYPENDEIVFNVGSWLGMTLESEDWPLWKRLFDLIMIKSIAIIPGWDTSENTLQRGATENALEIHGIQGIDRYLKIHGEFYLNDLSDEFNSRLVGICGLLYGNVFAANILELFGRGLNTVEVGNIAFDKHDSKPQEFPEIKSKLGDFLYPAQFTDGEELISLLWLRLRMTRDEYERLCALAGLDGQGEAIPSAALVDFADSGLVTADEIWNAHLRRPAIFP